MVALDLTFYEIHRDGYDPINEISDFWQNYDLKYCFDYASVLLVDLKSSNGKEKNSICKDSAHVFLIDLMGAIVAYYFAHEHDYDMNEIDVCALGNYNKNAEEIKFGKQIHEFFNRVSTDLKNKL